MLLYHRVADLDADPQRLAVTPAAFAAHLDILSRHATPLPLDDLVRRARAGSLPDRAVAITFDDGYADNLEAAVPLLERHGLPATIFVATGAIAGGREFWWDALDRLLLGPGRLPARVQVAVAGDVIVQDLSASASYHDRDRAQWAGWHVECAETPTPRHRLYRDLCARLRQLPGEACAGVIAALEAQADAAPDHQSHRPLTPSAVATLGARPGIDVGSHTMSHPSLAYLDSDDQRREIAGGRRQVESWTGSPALAFAYPFGGRRDVSTGVARTAADAGLAIACTTEPGRVHAGTDPLRVPRCLVRDCPADEFMQQWQAWTTR